MNKSAQLFSVDTPPKLEKVRKWKLGLMSLEVHTSLLIQYKKTIKVKYISVKEAILSIRKEKLIMTETEENITL